MVTTQPTFIDRKLAKLAETLGDADPRDLGLLIAVARAHQKRIAQAALAAADLAIDLNAFGNAAHELVAVEPKAFT